MSKIDHIPRIKVLWIVSNCLIVLYQNCTCSNTLLYLPEFTIASDRFRTWQFVSKWKLVSLECTIKWIDVWNCKTVVISNSKCTHCWIYVWFCHCIYWVLVVYVTVWAYEWGWLVFYHVKVSTIYYSVHKVRIHFCPLHRSVRFFIFSMSYLQL